MAFHVPDPTHRTFHHLLHAQIHHLGGYYRDQIDLRQLHEFALLARSTAPFVDWPLIWQRMRRYRLGTPLYSYALASQALSIFGDHSDVHGGQSHRVFLSGIQFGTGSAGFCIDRHGRHPGFADTDRAFF